METYGVIIAQWCIYHHCIGLVNQNVCHMLRVHLDQSVSIITMFTAFLVIHLLYCDCDLVTSHRVVPIHLLIHEAFNIINNKCVERVPIAGRKVE